LNILVNEGESVIADEVKQVEREITLVGNQLVPESELKLFSELNTVKQTPVVNETNAIIEDEPSPIPELTPEPAEILLPSPSPVKILSPEPASIVLPSPSPVKILSPEPALIVLPSPSPVKILSPPISQQVTSPTVRFRKFSNLTFKIYFFIFSRLLK
jgi:hypothetical protein